MERKLLRKYFLMGSQDCPLNRKPEDILKEAINGGITIFQFREKGPDSLSGDEKIALGKRLREICSQANIPFIINDDVELIETLLPDGIHVGQADLSVKALRNKHPDLLIGLSISNEEELSKSPLDLIDYVGAGAVYHTTTKSDASQEVGLAWIKKLRQLQPNLPFVGIGGITTVNAQAVIDAGADGVAVISAITKAEHISEAVRNL